MAHGNSLEVWVDRTRWLLELDPSGRQLVVSCGAVVEHLRLAVLAQGLRVRLEPAPDPRTPDLLARLTVVGPAHADDVDSSLIGAIPRRRMVRDPFEAREIPEGVVDLLRSDSPDVDAWVHPLTSRDDEIILAVLLEHANEAELADHDLQREMAAWRRPDAAPDGIPDAALPVMAARHATFVQRDFGVPAAIVRDAPELPVDEQPLLVVIGTPRDAQVDWLAAGRRVARLLLRAASLGIVASPLNQVIDAEPSRRHLRTYLGLVGWPQTVLRLGYGSALPVTGRRSVEDALTVLPE